MAAAVKAAAFAMMLRVLLGAFGDERLLSWGSGWPPVVALLALLSMFVGNIVAGRQESVKRMLAYSSIAHAGYALVGVVSVDVGLSLPDFRSAERTFQLLTQAAGRAGRGDAPGRVLVQTFYPEHYAVRFAAQQDYEGFFSKEIRFRRVMHYPPSTALANVVAQDVTLERAARVAHRLHLGAAVRARLG